MNQSINRRDLLRSGLVALGGAIVQKGFSHDLSGVSQVISPMVTEHVLQSPGKGRLIRINSNENPYGPPKTAYKAIEGAMSMGNRYAWDELTELTAKIAKKENVSPDHIMVGPGSADLLEKIAMILFRNGGNIISADPCFTFIADAAVAVGARWKAIPCLADWSHNLKAMEEAIDDETRLVYICNPNNPTGTITASKVLLDFCERVSVRVPVFVDEAYLELAVGADTESMVSLLSKKKNVIVSRTFSKVMGMAGLRAGYVVALPSFLQPIKKIVARAGMGLSNTTIFATMAAMDDSDFRNNTVRLNNEVKAYVCKNLHRLGYDYIPSYTSFVLFPIKMPANEILSKMAEKGLEIRALDLVNKPWCRVSMGTMKQMKLFINALESIS